MTPEELADLAHLRRARDLIDRGALASVPGCVAKDITRPTRETSRIGETPAVPAP